MVMGAIALVVAMVMAIVMLIAMVGVVMFDV